MPRTFTALAAVLLLAGAAPMLAQSQTPAAPAVAAPARSPITFDQYRTYRMEHLHKAQARLAEKLAAGDLTDQRKQRLEHVKMRLDQFAGLPADQQEAQLRRRFDAIDANHDGTIDRDEMKAFRAAHHHRGPAGERGTTNGEAAPKQQ